MLQEGIEREKRSAVGTAGFRRGRDRYSHPHTQRIPLYEQDRRGGKEKGG